ncbi:MAG: PilZ domain-containing protein [Bdellovibrionales bacterium]|nr:PilZ domain-containing protein [Bdellovibrionales bacterium]
MSAGAERRRYFRVTDQVLMSYQVVNDLSVKAYTRGGASGGAVRNAQALQALNQIEEKLAQRMIKLQSDHPELAEIVSLLNQKINLLVEGKERESEGTEQDKRALNVNVSACGIAFPAEESLKVGSLLVLQMTLTLSYITLSLSAQVVGVDPLSGGLDTGGGESFLIRADFVEISEVDQELLVQHVLKRQSEQLKALREARERGELKR